MAPLKTNLMNFDTFGLAEPILKAIASEGYSTPTPIQAKVIPLLLSERDVIGIAQTGAVGVGRTCIAISLCDREDTPLLKAIERRIANTRPNAEMQTGPVRRTRDARFEKPCTGKAVPSANPGTVWKMARTHSGDPQHKIDPGQAQDGLIRMLAHIGEFTQTAA